MNTIEMTYQTIAQKLVPFSIPNLGSVFVFGSVCVARFLTKLKLRSVSTGKLIFSLNPYEFGSLGETQKTISMIVATAFKHPIIIIMIITALYPVAISNKWLFFAFTFSTLIVFGNICV